MKKIIICAVLVLSGLTIGVYARGGRTAAKQNTSVTVVSDTTGSADDAAGSADADPSIDAQMDSAMQQAFGGDDASDDNAGDAGADGGSRSSSVEDGFGSPHFVLMVLLIVFGLPVLLVAVILYFVYRSRKAKYEMQKAAFERGMNPNPVYSAENRTRPQNAGSSAGTPYRNFRKWPDSVKPNEILWEEGVKQMCIGIGLALLLGVIIDAEFSFVGLLVFFIGLGKAIISKTRKNPADSSDFYVNQRYDTAGPEQPASTDAPREETDVATGPAEPAGDMAGRTKEPEEQKSPQN